ncbi:AmmeMemoRadiSam system protein A [Methylomonas sp. MED-D]|uniref:AmmeMemoRadiSam system protein A n=1 Tax=unclassified Methylomonas TaxID=2608980 RepID=UPI0028A57BCE|nr:AmmeMemoRadiSam system protein A [Methylomonas sp. MV1]MDT4331268.1 AmmeMemoRadiSam system protein A [Methylomonas sp. MV1]
MSLNDVERGCLLTLAKASIAHGLAHGRPLPVNLADYPAKLTGPAATFVTLELDGQLRGCIGRLEAARPLVEDIAENAYAAAFRDSRFPPVTAAELAGLSLHISVLSPSEPLYFASETDLISQLRPGIDGLILSEGGRRGTFLPSVWEDLPDPVEFLRHLKRKAGLPADYWSSTVKIQRYTTEMFG